MLYMTQPMDDACKIATQFTTGDVNKLAKAISKENNDTLAMRGFPNSPTMAQDCPIWIPSLNDTIPQERRIIVQRIQHMPLKQRMLLSGMQRNSIDIMPMIAGKALSDEANIHLADVLQLEKTIPAIAIASSFLGLSQHQIAAFKQSLGDVNGAMKEMALHNKYNIAGSTDMAAIRAKNNYVKSFQKLEKQFFHLMERYKLANNSLLRYPGLTTRVGGAAAWNIVTDNTAKNVTRTLTTLKWAGRAGIGAMIAGGGVKIYDAVQNEGDWRKVATAESIKIGIAYTGGKGAEYATRALLVRNSLMVGRIFLGLSPIGIAVFVGISIGGYFIGDWLNDMVDETIDKLWT